MSSEIKIKKFKTVLITTTEVIDKIFSCKGSITQTRTFIDTDVIQERELQVSVTDKQEADAVSKVLDVLYSFGLEPEADWKIVE